MNKAVSRNDAAGADLRALRKARGLTLAALSERLGKSVGWLSQVERDMSALSVTDLKALAKELDVPTSILLDTGSVPASEIGYVVRSTNRRPISAGKSGLVEELLSPDLTDDFEMIHSTFAPNSKIETPVTRPTQEVGYMISGKLDIEVNGTRFTIHQGDSFRIKGEPFRWMNPYNQPAVAIWAIAPPVY